MTDSSDDLDSTKSPDICKAADEASIKNNIEIWKQIVTVQQHFNDIGWRIRSLAITALTFTLGATFFGFLNAGLVSVMCWKVNPAAAVPILGLGIWLIFWFADGIWYHRLLTGAGRAAGPVEKFLKENNVEAGLSTEIAKSSHEQWLGKDMTSTRKLNLFYLSGVGLLLLTCLGVLVLGAGYAPVESAPSPSQLPSSTATVEPTEMPPPSGRSDVPTAEATP